MLPGAVQYVALIALSLFVAPAPVRASEAGDRVSYCIRDLRMPEGYPALARQARIQAAVIAEVSVPGPAESPTVRFLEGHAVLNAFVAKAASDSQYNPACAGTSILLRYIFSLDGTSGSATEITRLEPDVISVKTEPTGIICIMIAPPRKSWPKRWARKTGHALAAVAEAF